MLTSILRLSAIPMLVAFGLAPLSVYASEPDPSEDLGGDSLDLSATPAPGADLSATPAPDANPIVAPDTTPAPKANSCDCTQCIKDFKKKQRMQRQKKQRERMQHRKNRMGHNGFSRGNMMHHRGGKFPGAHGFKKKGQDNRRGGGIAKKQRRGQPQNPPAAPAPEQLMIDG